jgi:hypothetical protein
MKLRASRGRATGLLHSSELSLTLIFSEFCPSWGRGAGLRLKGSWREYKKQRPLVPDHRHGRISHATGKGVHAHQTTAMPAGHLSLAGVHRHHSFPMTLIQCWMHCCPHFRKKIPKHRETTCYWYKANTVGTQW